MAYFVFPFFFCLQSFFFFLTPPFLPLVPRETTTIPLGQDDGAVRSSQCQRSPHLCSFCPGPQDDLECSAGSVRETNGKWDLERERPWGGGRNSKGDLDALVWEANERTHVAYQIEKRTTLIKVPQKNWGIWWKSLWKECWPAEKGLTPEHTVLFLLLGDLRSFISFCSLWASPEYWCVYPLNVFSILLVFRPFPHIAQSFESMFHL